MKVKICGIMEPAQGKWAVEAGADFIGLIFAPSRRRITPEKGRTIGEFLAGEGLRDKVSLVGVFVNEEPEAVNQLAEACGLDYVQLSGDEPWDYCRLVDRPVIKAVKLAAAFSTSEVAAEIERQWARLGANKLAVLLEPLVPGAYGGAGERVDWKALGQLSSVAPILLAGGLNPENVEAACRLVRPWGVDVSSGVETDGVKDESKIRAFTAAARRSG